MDIRDILTEIWIIIYKPYIRHDGKIRSQRFIFWLFGL